MSSDTPALAAAKTGLRRSMSDDSLPTMVEVWVRLVATTVRTLSFGRIRLGTFGAGVVLTLSTLYTGISLFVLENRISGTEWYEIANEIGGLLPFYLWASFVAVLQAFAAPFYANRLRATISGPVVDAIDNREDIRDLRQWLFALFSKRRQLRVSLILAVVLAAASIWLLLERKPELVEATPFIVVCWIEGSFGLYFLFPSLSLASRLSKYRFRLFELDPAKSPMIEEIATMVNETLFVSVVIATTFSTGLFYFGFESTENQRPYLLLAPWLPILAIFAFYQYSLATIIIRSRRHALQHAQSLVESIRQAGPGAEMSATMKEIMALHDRAKASGTLAIDPKGLISFVTTMLVPLLSFIFGWWR